MTPEQQRIAIAEACGWQRYNAEGTDAYLPGDDSDPAFPDYLNDLNAMREAVKILPDSQKRIYSTILWDIANGFVPDWEPDKYLSDLFEVSLDSIFPLATSEAAQQAEAFLRTIGKWTS